MGNETQSTELQEFEVQDVVDSAIASGTFEAYVYKYKQGGRWIEALSARGVEHIGKQMGISITDHKFEQTEVDGLGKGVLCTAKATLKVVHPAETETQPDGTIIERLGYEEEISAFGTNFAPFTAYNKPDEFCWQKALTKAQRNARLQFIEVAAQKAAIKELLARQNAQEAPLPANRSRNAAAPKGQAQAQNGTATENAMQACFDTFGEKEQDLADLGVSKADFWGALGKVLNVKSRDDMTVAQWTAVEKSLKTVDFGKIVRDVFVECGVDLADLETPESDIPF